MRYTIFFLVSLILIAAISMSLLAGFKVHQSQSGLLYESMKSLDAKLGKRLSGSGL